MKILRSVCTLVVVCGVLVIFSTALAKADQTSGSDPRVRLGGDPSSAPAGVITPSFDVSTPSGTSGILESNATSAGPCILSQGGVSTTSPDCFFENDITINGVGQTVDSLTIEALGIAPSTVDCGFVAGSPFSDCGVGALPDGQGTAVTFDSGSLPFHGDFTFGFGEFPSDFQFSVQAGLSSTVVPEPGTLALLLSGGLGLAGLLVRRQVRAS
jgi:hypothetical protein